jgi:RHS repeat-associated protein
VLLEVEYTRDKSARITQKTETLGGVTDVYGYAYDLAGRLTAVEKNGVTVAAYSYDDNSNRLSFTGPGGTLSGSYDAQDRLLQYGGSTYTYSAGGELLRVTSGGRTTTYEYDALGTLVAIVLPDGARIEYIVDGENRRIGKTVNGILVQGFLYQDTLRPVAELDGEGRIVSRFVYGTRANVPEYMVRGGSTYRFVTDHLGSPRLLVDVGTGAVAQRLDYDEFGNVTTDTQPGFQPFGFAGGLFDRDSGLVRFGVRDYDASIGRWTTRDPILFESEDTNLYGYGSGDPINQTDITGRETESCSKRHDCFNRCSEDVLKNSDEYYFKYDMGVCFLACYQPTADDPSDDPYNCYKDCMAAYASDHTEKRQSSVCRWTCFGSPE